MKRETSTMNYLKPATLKEVCTLLSSYKGRAKLMGGGTDLKVLIRNGETAPEYLVDLTGIAELSFITGDADGVKIGALTTMKQIEHSPLMQEKFPILSQSAGQMGSPQVRNTATIAGNLCHAAPSADMAPALLALEAAVKVCDRGGERIVPLEKFFIGPGKTVLRDDEILCEIQVPPLPASSRGVYLKISARAALAIAMAGVAVVVTTENGTGRIAAARIAMGAVAPTPMRAYKAESILAGREPDTGLFEEAAQAAAEEARPISDIRCSADYRRRMVAVLVKRALEQLTAVNV